MYGASKLAGERAIAASGCRHLILRTRWVFAARGANFARTILRLAAQRSELAVVSDQLGVPTSAELIADVTALALYRIAGNSGEAAKPDGNNGLGGIYHLAAAGQTTWHAYAQLLAGEARLLGAKLKADLEKIKPIMSAEYPTPAARPHNSRLDTSRLRSAFGIAMPPWEFHVKRMLQETHFGDC